MATNWQQYAWQQAVKYGIDPSIFLRQIRQESGFNPNARSPAGALGIAQFMPATARSWGVNPLDPRSALAGAARMDHYYLSQYHGDWRKVLAAYNAGPGSVSGGYWQGIPQTMNYVRTILGSHSPIQQMPWKPATTPKASGSTMPLPAGGGSPAASPLALLASLGTLQPAQPLPQARDTLANLFAPPQPDQSQQQQPDLTPAQPRFSSQLDAIHSALLHA